MTRMKACVQWEGGGKQSLNFKIWLGLLSLPVLTSRSSRSAVPETRTEHSWPADVIIMSLVTFRQLRNWCFAFILEGIPLTGQFLGTTNGLMEANARVPLFSFPLIQRWKAVSSAPEGDCYRQMHDGSGVLKCTLLQTWGKKNPTFLQPTLMDWLVVSFLLSNF